MENRQLHFRDSRKDVEEHIEFIKANPHPISLILDRVSDQRNLASIFRIAEAARVKAIYGYQLPMIDQNIKLRRISRNTLNLVPFHPISTCNELKPILENKAVIALEITSQSIPYTEFQPSKELMMIIGSEKYGISKELLELVDQSIHIPMHGLNTSMNVAVATGIATFALLDKILKGEH